MLLMRGIYYGESSKILAAELAVDYKDVLELRYSIQAKAGEEQPEDSLPDVRTETDEMFQNAGGKR